MLAVQNYFVVICVDSAHRAGLRHWGAHAQGSWGPSPPLPSFPLPFPALPSLSLPFFPSPPSRPLLCPTPPLSSPLLEVGP